MTKVVLGGIVHQTKQSDLTPRQISILQRFENSPYTWLSYAPVGLPYYPNGTPDFREDEIPELNDLESMGLLIGRDTLWGAEWTITDAGRAALMSNKQTKQEALTPLDPSALQWLMQLRNGNITVSPSDIGLAALDALTRTPYASEIAGTNNLEEMGYRTFQITEAGIEYLQENGKMQKQEDAVTLVDITMFLSNGQVVLEIYDDSNMTLLYRNKFDGMSGANDANAMALQLISKYGWTPKLVEVRDGINDMIDKSKQQKQGGDSVDLILRASTALNGIICVDLNTPDQDAAEELVRWGTFTRYTSIPGNLEDLSDSAMCYQITPRALRNVTEGNFPGIKQQRSSLDELKAALEAKAEALTDDSPLYLTERGEAELKKIETEKDYDLSPDAVDLLLSFSDRDSLKDLMDSMYRSRLFDQLRDAGLIEPYGVNVDPYRRTFFLTPAGVAAQNEYMGANKSANPKQKQSLTPEQINVLMQLRDHTWTGFEKNDPVFVDIADSLQEMGLVDALRVGGSESGTFTNYRITPAGLQALSENGKSAKSVTKVLLGGIVHEIQGDESVKHISVWHQKANLNGRPINAPEDLSWQEAIGIVRRQIPADQQLLYFATLAVYQAVAQNSVTGNQGMMEWLSDGDFYSVTDTPSSIAHTWDNLSFPR